VHDYAITNFSQYTYGGTVTFAVYGTGKLTLGLNTGNACASGYSTSLNKIGPGVLQLTGVNTNITGAMNLYRGVLRIDSTNALPSGRLSLAGVLELGCDFERGWGNGAGQVCPLADGTSTYGASCGFSTYGGNHYVNLSGGTAIVWNGTASRSLASINAKLLLSTPGSDSTIDFRNPIDLNANPQTVDVADGSAAVDALLSGALLNGGLTKVGAGTLALTANNSYTQGTVVGAGTLLVNNTAGSGTGTGAVTVVAGATFGGGGVIVPGASNQVWIAGTLAPGAGSAVTGTVLTIDLVGQSNRVKFAPGGALAFKCGAAGSADRVKLLSFGSGKLTMATNTVVDVSNASRMPDGTFTLMEFYSDGGATLTDSGKPLSGFVLGTNVLAAYPKSWLDYTQRGKIVLTATKGGGVMVTVW
jgi:autotransporter-associated beta strand protein